MVMPLPTIFQDIITQYGGMDIMQVYISVGDIRGGDIPEPLI